MSQNKRSLNKNIFNHFPIRPEKRYIWFLIIALLCSLQITVHRWIVLLRDAYVDIDLYSNGVSYIQSGALIVRPNITWYCVYHNNDWGRIQFKVWLYKRHPYLTLTGELWGVFVRILEKIGRVLTAPHCIWDSNMVIILPAYVLTPNVAEQKQCTNLIILPPRAINTSKPK